MATTNISVNKKNKIFLATTALENFWDTSKPILFLSNACLRHSRKDYWKGLDYQVLYSPLENPVVFQEAYIYVNNFYERILPFLGEQLNLVHKTNHNIQYWRIVLGPWLMHYVQNIYERFITLESAINMYPDLTTIGLAEESFIVPRDFYNFVILLCDDFYNLQIYTKILTLMGKDFSRKNMEFCNISIAENNKNLIYGEIVIFARCLLRNFFPIVIKSCYFPSLAAEIELSKKCNGKLIFDRCKIFGLLNFPLKSEIRNKLTDFHGDVAINKFEKILLKLLPYDIPQCYVEGFKLITSRAGCYRWRPKAILSSESWYFDECFKQWAAYCSEKGTVLIGIQHGSNYGITSCHPYESHELAITRKFYSWGWQKKDSKSEIIPFYSPRLMCRKEIRADNKKTGILLVTNCFPRYFYRFQDFSNYDNVGYFNWQQQFVNALSEENRNYLRVRLFNEDYNYGHDCVQVWQDLNPKIQLETWDILYLHSLENCRIHVCDHLANTYLEALIANKPTILFWNPQIFKIRTEAQTFFDALHSEGILYYDPKLAAQAVDCVYDNIEEWWNNPRRQAVRKKFCNQFAKNSSDAIDLWATELMKLVK